MILLSWIKANVSVVVSCLLEKDYFLGTKSRSRRCCFIFIGKCSSFPWIEAKAVCDDIKILMTTEEHINVIILHNLSAHEVFQKMYK